MQKLTIIIFTTADAPSNPLSNSLATTKSIQVRKLRKHVGFCAGDDNFVFRTALQHKKDLLEALRRTNPAGVSTAPMTFWDVEGSLKTVIDHFNAFGDKFTVF
jgi:hypothetical protein